MLFRVVFSLKACPKRRQMRSPVDRRRLAEQLIQFRFFRETELDPLDHGFILGRLRFGDALVGTALGRPSIALVGEERNVVGCVFLTAIAT